MVRTLETATGVFGNGIPQEPGTMMMTALEPQQQWQAEHAAAALPPGIPVIAHEGCRERVSESLLLSLQFSDRVSVTKQALELATPA